MCVISSLTAPLNLQVPKTEGSVQKVKVILTRSKLTEVNQNLIRSSMGNSQYCCKVWRQNSYSLLSYRVNKVSDLEGHSDLDLGPRSHQGHSLAFPVHH